MRALLSSRHCGVLTTYSFFIMVALAYSACLWQVSMPDQLSRDASVPPLIVVNSKADTQAVVETPSVTEKIHRSHAIEITAELRCLALNIYFEARGESADGQLAVGHVVMNRVTDAKFPDTVCDVIHQGGQKRRNRCQFSWWCDGKNDVPQNKKAWLAAVKLAYQIKNGWTIDPTDGALWYHATYVQPYWRRLFVVGPQIGRHIFYRYA